MAMLGQELTQRYNKFTEKVIEFVTVATALAMMAFAAWQLWMQYFVTPGGKKKKSMTLELVLQNRPIAI